MPSWIVDLIGILIAKLSAWLFTKSAEIIQGKKEEAATSEEVDKKLAAVKAAYQEAFNGEKVTPEQREKLKKAISDFLRGSGNGGL